MKQYAWSAMALLLCLTTGCVERTFIISTDVLHDPGQTGALVLRNNTVIGPSPADDHFVYYGKYYFDIIKDGYQPLHAEQYVAPPWYQIPPLDFFFENLYPFTIKDERRLTFTLQPVVQDPPQAVADRAVQLRARAAAIGAPSQGPPPPNIPPGAPVAPRGGVPVTTPPTAPGPVSAPAVGVGPPVP
jgi:hypothetical protein